MFLCAGERPARNEERVALTNDGVAVAYEQHPPRAAQALRTQWADEPLAKLAAFYALLPGTYRKTDGPGLQTQRVTAATLQNIKCNQALPNLTRSSSGSKVHACA
jgi:hypothetical protein